MPLTELLEMTNEKVDATQDRPSNSYHPSPRPETDFCELVWENGQIVTQGQSSKARKGPLTTNDYQLLVHNLQDDRDVNGPKTNKFSMADSVLSDMGLGQDVDMLSWLNYSADDPLHNDYTCDFLPELSGITMNDIPTDNHFAFREKSGYHGDDHPNTASLKHCYASKVGVNTSKYSRGESSGVAQFLLSSQNVPKSGVSGITGDVGGAHNVASQDLYSSSLTAFTRSRLQKLDAGGQPSTSASFTNFPYFSRSAALAKANHVIVNSSQRSQNDEQRCTVTCIPTDSTHVNLGSGCSRRDIGAHNQSVQTPADDMSRSLPKKPTEDPVSTKRTVREEDGMNDATMSKVGTGGERNVEPAVAASSVCSGNSVDRASDERGYDLKRKSRETTESEGPSTEEVEEESMGTKKAAHARASSKRRRAAEVHNLSERKRRDRINEKMRALQELIPNCNKVDKASMLEEAIDYLKTLQLQVQMLSMGAGLYMQPMMLPPGMQPIHGAQMPHFPPMGLGMGMGMGFGMNMYPFQGPHYPSGAAAQFHGMSGPNLLPFGNLGQSLQMSMQPSPLHSVPGAAPVDVPVGLNVSGIAGSSGPSNLVPSSIAKESDQQVRTSTIPHDSMNHATDQAAKEGIQPSPLSHDRNASESSLLGTNNVA
ncbi:hypothetical protein RND81_04G219800 [Saponaria officinalis]|uniref:BHLH domain-containing protein n=1 Tax=Saponaria officinalis TaxID=3572 RepID=A0AAW1LQA4_SAPOF